MLEFITSQSMSPLLSWLLWRCLNLSLESCCQHDTTALLPHHLRWNKTAHHNDHWTLFLMLNLPHNEFRRSLLQLLTALLVHIFICLQLITFLFWTHLMCSYRTHLLSVSLHCSVGTEQLNTLFPFSIGSATCLKVLVYHMVSNYVVSYLICVDQNKIEICICLYLHCFPWYRLDG